MLEQELLMEIERLEFEEDDKLDDFEQQLVLRLDELELWLLPLSLFELDEQLWLMWDEDSELHEELSEVWLEQALEQEEQE